MLCFVLSNPRNGMRFRKRYIRTRIHNLHKCLLIPSWDIPSPGTKQKKQTLYARNKMYYFLFYYGYTVAHRP
jgi:hypothetical protein